MSIRAAFVAAAFQLAWGIRNRRSNGMMMASVPIYNYDMRHLQHKGSVSTASAEFDWVLAFKASTSDKQLVDFCGGEAGQGECRVRGHPDKGGAAFVTLQGTEARLRQKLEEHRGEVEFVEPDLPVDVIPDVPSTSSTSEAPWSHEKVGLSRAKHTGKGVHIYVMDTGVRTTHSDFGGRAIPTVDTLSGNGVVKECNGDHSCSEDYNGHGTHCAGSAGGSKYGVATEATLYAMRVCCGPGTNVHAGMDWVVAKGNRPAIMTVSLAAQGVSEASLMVVNAAVAAGVTVFVGAANDNVDTCTMTYGFIPAAISVGATDSTDRRASFSNWGSCNDIYAPGVKILSAWKDSDTDYKVISGTSMATPLAAGAGALLIEEDPTLTPAGVRAKMIRLATRDVITDLKDSDPNLLLSLA